MLALYYVPVSSMFVSRQYNMCCVSAVRIGYKSVLAVTLDSEVLNVRSSSSDRAALKDMSSFLLIDSLFVNL